MRSHPSTGTAASLRGLRASSEDLARRYLPRPVKSALRPLLRSFTRVSNQIDARKSLHDPAVQQLLADPRYSAVHRRDGGVRVVEETCPRPWDLAAANRRIAVDALESVGARYFDVGGTTGLRSTIAVLAPDWERFVTRLARASDDDVAAVYIDLVHGEATTTHLRASWDPDPAALTSDQIRIYLLQRRSPEARVQGFESRCVVQRWDPAPEAEDPTTDPVYVARAVNGIASEIAGSQVSTVDVVEWGRPRRRLSPGLPSPLSPPGPIDVVYLWVDGADPVWIEKMLRARGDDVHQHSYDASRFRDRGELKHSIRSLLLNAPWVNHVYLVTDDQVPSWLDLTSSRLTVVDHRDIFSERAVLPTFNSHAIGSRLHHIPGLADRYLLMNDDVFINAPAPPDLFFNGAGAAVVPIGRSTPRLVAPSSMSPVESARANTAALIAREYGRMPTRLFRHTPVPQLKSLMAELEERHSSVFAHLERSQFRSHEDHVVNSWLHHYVALQTGRGVPGRHDYRYINLASPRGWPTLRALSPTSGTITFCINDVGDGESGDESPALEDWLSAYFPEPSEVEL